MKITPILQIWDKFWFEQVSPAPICLFRIFYGLLVIAFGLLWAPDLLALFGPNGLVSIGTMQQYEQLPRLSLLFLLPPDDSSVIAVFALLLLSAVAVTAGLFTRPSLIVLFLCLVSFHHRNVAILNSGDTLLRVMGFVLIFSPAGKMFSVDQLRSRSGEDPWKIKVPCWTQRLLQLQIAALYCQTFFAKLGGDTWLNGTAVYYTSRLEEFARFPIPYLFDHLWTCQLLTWGTLAIELSLWTLVWVKELRYYVLLVGVVFHLGIDWTMNIPLFEYVMIASYINFVEASDLKRILAFFGRHWRCKSLKTVPEPLSLHDCSDSLRLAGQS